VHHALSVGGLPPLPPCGATLSLQGRAGPGGGAPQVSGGRSACWAGV